MQRISVGDTNLAVLRSGHRGYPLLLVHGFPLNHSQWRPQFDFFADHCRVIDPDLRGFGASDVSPGTVTLEQMADDLHDLLGALEIREKVIFCGLSMGGYVAWQFWRKYKEQVLAMIVCDTRTAPDTPEGAAGRRQLAARILAEGSTVAADAMLPKLFAADTQQKKPYLIDRARQMIARNQPAGLAAALEGMAVRPDARGIVESIDVPSLVIVGQHDAVTTVHEMRQMADAIPNAACVIVPSAGHLAPLENPFVANEAIAKFITL
jgi:3-oxoadipate enol-lactonase